MGQVSAEEPFVAESHSSRYFCDFFLFIFTFHLPFMVFVLTLCHSGQPFFFSVFFKRLFSVPFIILDFPLQLLRIVFFGSRCYFFRSEDFFFCFFYKSNPCNLSMLDSSGLDFLSTFCSVLNFFILLLLFFLFSISKFGYFLVFTFLMVMVV